MAEKKIVRVVGMVGRFKVEGLPDITTRGVELNKTQVEKAREAAKASRVVLSVQDEDRADDSDADAPATPNTTETQTAATPARGGRS